MSLSEKWIAPNFDGWTLHQSRGRSGVLGIFAPLRSVGGSRSVRARSLDISFHGLQYAFDFLLAQQIQRTAIIQNSVALEKEANLPPIIQNLPLIEFRQHVLQCRQALVLRELPDRKPDRPLL